MTLTGTVARRLSIHRATTIGPKSSPFQVVLKNTYIVKDPSHVTTSAPVNRSQSLLTTNHRVPTLAPPRSERARIEALLSDVWSRDILPFPGMTNRSRSEHLVRSSASSVMRKLSVASIASSFGRRPGSLTSLHKAWVDAETGDGDDDSGRAPEKTSGEESIDWKMPFGEDSDAGGKARLSMIEDEQGTKDRVGQDGPSPRTSDAARPGTDHSQGSAPKRLAWAQNERRVVSLSPASTSAANSVQLSRPQSKQSLLSSEKENDQPAEKVPEVGQQIRRVRRARTFKEGSRKGKVISGIREIFR